MNSQCFSLFALSSLILFGSSFEQKRTLYLFFPKNGEKLATKELVTYNKMTKERVYRKETLYHFPCKTVIGDFRFITVEERNAKCVSKKYLSKIDIKDCKWINSYRGTGLNQYNQNSEFSDIYIIEQQNLDAYKIIKVKPEMREYN